jgi:hypothetical protein
MLGASMNEKASGEGERGRRARSDAVHERSSEAPASDWSGGEEQPEEEWRAAIGVFRWQW